MGRLQGIKILRSRLSCSRVFYTLSYPEGAVVQHMVPGFQGIFRRVTEAIWMSFFLESDHEVPSVTTDNILFLSILFYSMMFLLVPRYSSKVYSSFCLVLSLSTLVLCHAYWNLLALAVSSIRG
jgi:hypothetical protein